MGAKYLLLVEDEVELAEQLCTVLEEAGYQVQCVNNYIEALTKTQNQEYFCIICDLKLPKGSGIDVIKQIRTNPKHLNYKSPIILMSGNFDPDSLKSVAGKIQGALVKPFKHQDLLNALSAMAKK